MSRPPMDAELRELLDRFLADGDHAAFADLDDAVRPLVASACRGLLRDEAAVQDTVQETLIKLVRHAESVRGNVAAWLTTAARNAATDRIRREAAEGRRLRGLAQHLGGDGGRDGRDALSWEAALARLDRALAELDPQTRQLVRERFIHGHKLRDLADARERSVATLSRDVARALRELTAAFADLGGLTDDPPPGPAERAEAGLRLGLRQRGPDPSRPLAPGWSRPVRVGVMLSYRSLLTPNQDNWRLAMGSQVKGTELALDPRFDFVSMVEPNTSHHGVVERTIRDFDLDDGVVDATDPEALRTLDVIWLGRQWAMLPEVARALRATVEAGTGLLSKGEKQFCGEDPNVRALILASEPPHLCCTMPRRGVHHHPMPATVRRGHAALPGLRAGDRVEVDGCAMCVTLAPGAEALVTFDDLRPGDCRCAACRSGRTPPLPNPPLAAASGTVGRGRVMVFYVNYVEPLLAPTMPGNDLRDVLLWLAAPRRQ